MGWREELRRVTFPDGRKMIGGSFRGVPFFVESVERRGGRRVDVHEFSRGDIPSIGDQGRRARPFPVDAYLIGDDYMKQRDRLISALEDVAGAGELVHPYYGVRRAVCDTFTLRESTSEGGLGRISIEFIEAPELVRGRFERPNLAATADAAATSTAAAVDADLAADYHATGAPAHALSALATLLEQAGDALSAALGPIVSNTQELARLELEVQSIAASASTLVREPGDALSAFRSALGSVGETALDAPRDVFGAFTDAYWSIETPTVVGSTPTRLQEAANVAALANALRTSLALEAARLVVRVPYLSAEEAASDRDKIVAILDAEAESAADESFGAIVSLRSAVAQAVPGDSVIGRVQEFEQRTAAPAIVLSHTLYGTTSREDELLELNGAAHPGFLSGTLKAVSDV